MQFTKISGGEGFVRKILSLFAVILLGLTLFGSNIKMLKIVMDKNYPPYSFIDSNGNPAGISVDLWREWEKITNVKVEFLMVDWKNAIPMILSGKADVVDDIFYSDERAKILDYTKPFDKIETVIFFDKKLSGIANLKSLKGFKVGVKSADYDAAYAFQHGVENLVFYDSYDSLVKAAKDKDIHIFIADKSPAIYYLTKYNLMNQFKYSSPLYTSNLYRAVKKGREALVKTINDGFAKIPESTVKDIMKKWKGTSVSYNLTTFLPYLILMIAIIGGTLITLFAWNQTLKFKVKREVRELEKTIKEKEEIKKKMVELSDKLSQVNVHLLKMNEKFMEMVDLISNFSPLLDEREFFEGLLDIAISLVPEATAGSISLIKGEKWKYIAVRGHDEKKLKSLDLKAEWMFKIKKVEVIEEVVNEDFTIMPKDIAEKIKSASGGHLYRNLAVPIEMNGEYIGNIFLDALEDVQFSEESKYLMGAFGKLASSFVTLKEINKIGVENNKNLLRTLTHFMEMKSPYLRGHSERVAGISTMIGKQMNLSTDQIEDLRWTALLHDMGKLGIPDAIVFKFEKLTNGEYEILKTYPVISEQIVSSFGLPKRFKKIVLHHREYFNGKGYPDGIRDSEIPLLSKIILIADDFDTMINVLKMDAEDVIKDILKNSGTKYDPEIVESSVDILRKYAKKLRR